jgi:hypothetical protein
MSYGGNPQSGFSSLIALVISMLIVFALMISYLRNSASSASGSRDGPVGTLDAVKRRASDFEEQQRRRMEDLQQAGQ